MDIHVLIAQMIQLFLIMFCGYGLFKLGILNPEVDSHLTRLMVNVTMPLIILNSVLTRTKADDSSRVITVFLVSLVVYLLLPLVSFSAVRLLHLPQNQQGVYAFMNTYSNVGLMGFPMITALYGEQALLYAAVLNILFNLSAYSIGVWMMHYGSGKKSGLSLKAILNPGMIGSILALLLYFFPVQVPAPVTGAIGSIGGLTSPLAMLLIGANLAGMPFREMFNDWKIYIFTALKQLLGNAHGKVPYLLDHFLMDCRITDNTFLSNLLSASFKLGLDQADDLTILCKKISHRSQYFCQGNKGNVN